jgi:hypothetical protein
VICLLRALFTLDSEAEGGEEEEVEEVEEQDEGEGVVLMEAEEGRGGNPTKVGRPAMIGRNREEGEVEAPKEAGREEVVVEVEEEGEGAIALFFPAPFLPFVPPGISCNSLILFSRNLLKYSC